MTNRREFLKGCTTTLSVLFLSVLGLAKDTKAESVEKQPESMAERIAAGDTVVLVNGSEIQCIDVQVLPSRWPSIYKGSLLLQFSETGWDKMMRRYKAIRSMWYVFVEVYRNGTRQVFHCSVCWRLLRNHTVQWNVDRMYTTYTWKI